MGLLAPPGGQSFDFEERMASKIKRNIKSLFKYISSRKPAREAFSPLGGEGGR